MNAAFLTTLITTLRGRANQLREESERRLIMAACSGVAIIVCSSIGLTCYHFVGLWAMSMATLLAAGVLIPISLLIGIALFNGLKRSWVTSGDIFQRLRYLDYEFFEDQRRLNGLAVSNEEKQKFIAERYQKYLDETAPFREQVRSIDSLSSTSLIKDWRSRP